MNLSGVVSGSSTLQHFSIKDSIEKEIQSGSDQEFGAWKCWIGPTTAQTKIDLKAVGYPLPKKKASNFYGPREFRILNVAHG